jgi:hypothetical protein
MDRFEKIRKIAEVVQGDNVVFIIRRTEPVEREEEFKKLHENYGVECKLTRVSATTRGELGIDKFIAFIKEYDDQFELGTTVIEMESVVINPLLM